MEVVNRIHQRLRDDVGDVGHDLLVGILCPGHTYLSGSYLLQCIIDEKWKESDIDIFTDNPDLFVDSGIMKRASGSLPYYDSEFEVADFHMVDPRYSDKKIQIIHCKVAPMRKIMQFDFTFLRNAYDGKTMIIQDLRAIFQGSKGDKQSSLMPGRAEKYRLRGFNC